MFRNRFRRVPAIFLSLALIITYIPTSPIGGATAGIAYAAAPIGASDTFVPNAPYDFQDHEANVGARLNDLASKLTLDEIVALEQSTSTAVPRLGLNAGRSSSGEGLHGVVDTNTPSTIFPSSFGLSQTWDKDLFNKIGDVIAKESQAGGGSIGRLAPVLDLLRDPRYGRSYETLGEDAYLTGSLGTEMAKGMNARTADGYQQFIPILKHVLGYNTEVNRLWLNSVLPQRSLYEYYDRTFKYSVEAGASKSLMNSYPVINGKPMSVHPVQAELLREWTPDYDGTGHYEFTTRNDAGSGSSLFVHSQRYFNDDPAGRALGVGQGAKNGEMSWSFRAYGQVVGPIYDALARGLVTEADLLDNAKRSIAMNLRMGDYDQIAIQSPYVEQAARLDADVVYENRELALRASQEQIVLLKNEDDILPLKGDLVKEVALLGPLADQVLKDHYTGAYSYSISIKDALENKLGADNVKFDRAVDTVAIKAANGNYLVSANNTFRTTGGANLADTPVLAAGTAKPTLDDIAGLFEWHQYGVSANLFRTPINNLYLQVSSQVAQSNPEGTRLTLYNNTSSPGEANLETGRTQYVLYQNFRVVPTGVENEYGLYNMVAGNGTNRPGGVGLAYDADDEELNGGTYLAVTTSAVNVNRIMPDLDTRGSYRNEVHAAGPSITDSPVDTNGADGIVDKLPANAKFKIETLRSTETAAEEIITDLDNPDAPVILVLGYEPHLNAKEAIDLDHTGLSDQQMRLINKVTATTEEGGLERDVILIVKTGNPMVFDETVSKNDKIRAIVEIGHTGQEEGSALVSALFDDGYSVPATGFAPAASKYSHTPFSPTDLSHKAYPGYLEAGNKISAYAPAGRLSATWYYEIEDMKGASEDHPPASYAHPAFDEGTNDNQSNMNGTINTGLNIYDIIKGERTYQYFKGEPLYEFGYGLTYADFEYSELDVSAIANGKFTVSGTLTNNSDIASDEVIQIYSSKPTSSRIIQPLQKLIAYDRVNVPANGSVDFEFEIDLTDKLGVWDVETSEYIVEPGDYTIKAAKSSSDKGDFATLTVTTTNGGKAAAARYLTKLTLAEAFDDYSDIGGRIDDIELISASPDYESNTAVQYRKNGAWINFKNVSFSAVPEQLTVQLSSDRDGSLAVYALEPGADPETALADATPIATFALTNNRPTVTLTNLGIGPVGFYPGSPNGQNTKDNYEKPVWQRVSTSELTGLTAGSYDIYFVTTNRGANIEWLKFGVSSENTTTGVEISQLYKQFSIRHEGGELALRADVAPLTSTEPVEWSIVGSTPADIASIDKNTGVLTANKSDNGTVKVRAESGEFNAEVDILITNQLAANKVTVGENKRTVEYLQLRTGNGFGQTDNISRYQGSNQQAAIFSELFSEHDPATITTTDFKNYYVPNVYSVITADQIDWSVTSLDGDATDLATISADGLLTATGDGDGDGKVKVKASLKANPDITAERVITIQNQTKKDAYKWIQTELYDDASAIIGTGSTYGTSVGLSGNEMGMYLGVTGASIVKYSNVDFGEKGAGKVYARLAGAAGDVVIDVWADAPTESDDGVLLGTLNASPTGSVYTYNTFAAELEPLDGVHDLYLVTATDSKNGRINWLQFAVADDTTPPPTGSFTVTYNANEGTGTVTDSTAYAAGATVTVKAVTGISRDGYTFASWNTAANGSGTTYLPGATFSISANTVLYAQWTADTAPPTDSFTVTYNSNGGTGSVVDDTAYASGAAVTVKAVTGISRSGYTFASWNTAASGSGTTYLPGATFSISANTVLYAQWTADTTPTPPSTPGSNPGNGTIPNAPSPSRSTGTDPVTTQPPATTTPDTSTGIGVSGVLAAYPDGAAVSSWAQIYFERLITGGVISGRSDGTLDPAGDVTRAEFTKMIVSALNITSAGTPGTFSDVTDAGWFKQYVDIASSRGIVNGLSDTIFGPDSKISRQDLCVIAYRALKAQGVALPELIGAPFPDDAKIADYAKEATVMLKQLNIIGGRTDGSFDPTAFATREETAKIVCGIIDYTANAVAAAAAAASSAAEAPAATEPEAEEPAAPTGSAITE
ncbi:MAG: glycoside hydrolase family 3 C-terminal domain-containing protein [Clostridiales Family XIII bacterium]|jgi:beta-glucosidase|nr:glycoside hydrolase family 3 C-terminal domain-containing protein [Clostridiales Family XIII bacterium]